MYPAVPARLATVVAMRPSLAAMWDGQCGDRGSHTARRELEPVEPVEPGKGVLPELERGWDGACERCAAPIAWSDEVRVGGGLNNVWDTPSGDLEPGCLYWSEWLDSAAGGCFYRWSNCDGRHLHGILPNGRPWDIDSRAGNCGSPDDTEHRCWVRHGEPPAVHVDKDGLTCSAGAGSIVAGDYHGFLHHGMFTAG